MSFMDKVKSGLDRAQHEIDDFTQTTKLKREVTKLQNRKTELFGQIGQQVYTLHAKGQTIAEIEAQCKEIDVLEQDIQKKNEEIAKVGTQASPPAPKPA